MGYIKINLRSRRTDESGKAVTTTISRFETDLPGLKTYEMNMIMHALAIKGEVEIINSCFGAGYWVNDKPWLNDEAWTNNV